jgi:cytidylate kinase
MPRSVEALVEHQARQWQLARTQRPGEPRRAIVTVTHLHGAGGDELARRLARDLSLEVFDREILHQIAESMHLSEKVVEALDDRAKASLTEWLEGFAGRHFVSSAEYRYQLARVIGAIAQHGGAIILGRGAHLVLRAGEALRVLVVASFEDRVSRVMKREGVAEEEARRQIRSVEADRRAFLLKHFHAELEAATDFDLIVNTSVLGVAGAAATVRAACEALFGSGGAAAALPTAARSR